MIWLRRELYADDEFFKMSDVLDTLAEDLPSFRINTYRTETPEEYKLKAGLVGGLGDRTILTVDERLLENARKGALLDNFVLAHEITHWAQNDHATGAITKNFQLFSGPSGASNAPPTTEEWLANFGAVCFQCGVALENNGFEPLELARRAFSDPYWVKKVQRLVQCDAYQKELHRPRPKRQRVIL